MGLLATLKTKSKHLKKEITAIYYAYQHPKVSRLPRMIMLFTLGYALSPVDLIPDFIPIFGYLDDLIILPALISLSIKLIPQDILDESRKKAKQEPLQLKKNWFFAVLFMLIWIFLLIAIVSAIV
ncbi:hypothetical protein U27_02937 [Candidatus Vecturithrix granuli]|uniref:DUF1232 domain-containing protein n=1 Tax=Vecturithrix granuli TaxID=1499967 RepID=A0A081BUH1_VECG1|nr:hypothetical protein U27_02937 [Candidatus Vecturithrix granuli]